MIDFDITRGYIYCWYRLWIFDLINIYILLITKQSARSSTYTELQSLHMPMRSHPFIYIQEETDQFKWAGVLLLLWALALSTQCRNIKSWNCKDSIFKCLIFGFCLCWSFLSVYDASSSCPCLSTSTVNNYDFMDWHERMHLVGEQE